MSPANIYRFFTTKAEINAAVCGRLFGEIEATAEDIARSSGPASKTLRNLIASVESRNSLRSLNDPKLHELFQTAYDENWPMVHEHSKRMDRILEEVIRQGMAAGEFRAGDAALAAIRFVCACIRSCDPRLMVECVHPNRSYGVWVRRDHRPEMVHPAPDGKPRSRVPPTNLRRRGSSA
jgi:AcrR family transcriptional regulator